jgi:hypothetical protein
VYWVSALRICRIHKRSCERVQSEFLGPLDRDFFRPLRLFVSASPVIASSFCRTWPSCDRSSRISRCKVASELSVVSGKERVRSSNLVVAICMPWCSVTSGSRFSGESSSPSSRPWNQVLSHWFLRELRTDSAWPHQNGKQTDIAENPYRRTRSSRGG